MARDAQRGDRGAAVSTRQIVVIGGGVAGIAAALDCAAAGARVTLLEVRPRLGGAAYSFQRDGLWLDNGQHVFLRCYTAYRALLERLGSANAVTLQRRFEIPVLRPAGGRALLRRSSLPAPLHLAGSLLRYRFLTPGERLRVARAALALSRLSPENASVRERAQGTSLGDWLCEHGQTERTLELLWDLIALPALNVSAMQGSLVLGAFTLQEGLLRRADAGDVGFHLRPFNEVISAPAHRTLRQAGVRVLLRARVQAVTQAHDDEARPGRLDALTGPSFDSAVQAASSRSFSVSVGGGPCLAADAVICAVQHARAAALLEPLLGGAETRRWLGLGSSPIVNVHVIYDRRVCELAFAAGVQTPLQYVFDRSEAVGVADGGQCLAVSLSGAEEDMRLDSERLRARYLRALAELFPAARCARVREVYVSREHAATFKAVPGVDAHRPPPRTAVPGLALAGAWTRTGWPATLEGAVRSGHAAAREVLG